MFKVKTKNINGNFTTFISLVDDESTKANPKDEPYIEECAMAFIPDEVVENKVKRGRKKNV